MTTTPNEPVRDEDIETTGLGSTTAPGTNATGDGTRDGAEGGPLDTQDESDSDSSDAGGGDADGGDADGGDADGGDADGGGADGSDGSRDGVEGGPLDTQDESDSDSSDA